MAKINKTETLFEKDQKNELLKWNLKYLEFEISNLKKDVTRLIIVGIILSLMILAQTVKIILMMN